MWMKDDKTSPTPALSVLEALRQFDGRAPEDGAAAAEGRLRTGDPARGHGRFTLLLQEIDAQMAELLLGKRKKDVEEEEEFDDEEEEEDDLEEDERKRHRDGR